MSSKIRCPGCGNEIDWNGEPELRCPYGGDIISAVDNLLEDSDKERLGIAAGYRRVGRFDDAQQEIENLLERKENFPLALFGSFLNAYEVTEYAFDKNNKVKICKCNSTSRRPVKENKDWESALTPSSGAQKEQWLNLSERIEELRQYNIKIKQSLPKYRAILICDYENELDNATAHGIYNELSTKTDIFFPPITLQDIREEAEKEKYLIQAIKNPEIAPLMFVVYSDAFNYRNKADSFYSNVAGQCREFAKVHTKGELFSVTCDYEPSAMMKTISVKTERFENFEKSSYKIIAQIILEDILISAYDDDEYERYEEGEIIKLNGSRGLSPKVYPLGK